MKKSTALVLGGFLACSQAMAADIDLAISEKTVDAGMALQMGVPVLSVAVLALRLLLQIWEPVGLTTDLLRKSRIWPFFMLLNVK